VLLVEDEFLIALDIETAMREAGLDVVGVARTADQAVDFARTQRPALVIMDIHLAGKRDGIDAALDIYRETGIRCIFATAHHDHATKARADPSCPLGWLMKPYTTVALVRMVKQALGSL
jgi:DNA-binding NarL/FixJ family response regulator